MNRLRAFIRLIPYWAVIWPFWFYFRILCQGCVKNEEVIKKLKDRGFILAPNHVSYFDWIVLHIYFLIKHDIKITFFAKSKVLNHPVLGKLVTGGRCIAVDRSLVNSNLNRELLNGSKHFVIFPEGTRSGDGNLLKGKSGVVKIARKTGLPVIPTALIGFYELWPRHKWLPGINRLQIVFGNPCNVDEIGNNRMPVDVHTRFVMQKIAGLMGKIYDY